MPDPMNGADVMPGPVAESDEQPALTFEQLCSLTVGQLLEQLEHSGDPLLLEATFTLSGPESRPKIQPGTNIGIMVTRDVGYIEHVKARMRREAKQAHDKAVEALDAEAKAALGGEQS